MISDNVKRANILSSWNRFICDSWDQPLHLLLRGLKGGLIIQIWLNVDSATNTRPFAASMLHLHILFSKYVTCAGTQENLKKMTMFWSRVLLLMLFSSSLCCDCVVCSVAGARKFLICTKLFRIYRRLLIASVYHLESIKYCSVESVCQFASACANSKCSPPFYSDWNDRNRHICLWTS